VRDNPALGAVRSREFGVIEEATRITAAERVAMAA
jgi:hypothetical protein